MLEAVSDAVIKADWNGEPGVWLQTSPRGHVTDFPVDGLSLLADHAKGIFAPGGVAKSLLALYLGGRLNRQGVAVGYADSESKPGTSATASATVPRFPPAIRYVRCKRSVPHEVDRLREETAQHQIPFGI